MSDAPHERKPSDPFTLDDALRLFRETSFIQPEGIDRVQGGILARLAAYAADREHTGESGTRGILGVVLNGASTGEQSDSGVTAMVRFSYSNPNEYPLLSHWGAAVALLDKNAKTVSAVMMGQLVNASQPPYAGAYNLSPWTFEEVNEMVTRGAYDPGLELQEDLDAEAARLVLEQAVRILEKGEINERLTAANFAGETPNQNS